jgi:hypothetical protein
MRRLERREAMIPVVAVTASSAYDTMRIQPKDMTRAGRVADVSYGFADRNSLLTGMECTPVVRHEKW